MRYWIKYTHDYIRLINNGYNRGKALSPNDIFPEVYITLESRFIGGFEEGIKLGYRYYIDLSAHEIIKLLSDI